MIDAVMLLEDIPEAVALKDEAPVDVVSPENEADKVPVFDEIDVEVEVLERVLDEEALVESKLVRV